MVDQNEKPLDVDWQIEDSDHAILYKRAEPFLQTRFNALHTRIAYFFALMLLKKKDGNPEVVIPAILLHDIGWSVISEGRQVGAFGPEIRKPELNRLHEIEGARMARNILADLGCPEDRIGEIQNIISGHDSRHNPINVNDAIVKDADKLWRFTHEGFTIDYQRFGKTKNEHYIWLFESIPKWFLIQGSTTLAKDMLLQRKKEYGIEHE